MLNYLLKFIVWTTRKLNKNEPSRGEVAWALSYYNHTSNSNNRIRYAMSCYSEGSTYEEIANFMKCTRERVRQLILKGCRQAMKRYDQGNKECACEQCGRLSDEE